MLSLYLWRRRCLCGLSLSPSPPLFLSLCLLSACLSLPGCLPADIFACLSVCLPLCLSVCLSVFAYPVVFVSLPASLFVSLCLSVSLTLCPVSYTHLTLPTTAEV